MLIPLANMVDGMDKETPAEHTIELESPMRESIWLYHILNQYYYGCDPFRVWNMWRNILIRPRAWQPQDIEARHACFL